MNTPTSFFAGPVGPPGMHPMPLASIGVPSPQSVEQIQVIKLEWDYLAGSVWMRRVEIWQHNQLLASREYSLGAPGPDGPA